MHAAFAGRRGMQIPRLAGRVARPSQPTIQSVLGADLLGLWDANRSDLITLSGSAMTSWKDAVAGYNLTAGLATERPLYSATSFNGAPGVTFDGVDDYLNMESAPFPIGASPAEIWALVKQDALPANTSIRSLFSYGGDTANNRRLLRRFVSSGFNRVQSSTGTSGGSVDVSLSGVDFSQRHVVRSVYTGTHHTVALDGSSSSSQALVASTTSVRTRLGSASGNTPGSFWHGQVAAVLVTNVLSAEKATALYNLLAARRD